MSACGHEKDLISIDEAIQSILNTAKNYQQKQFLLKNKPK